jgi:pyruvate,water dikinase
MPDIRTFGEISADDVQAVGGKGLSLGLLAGAGLPVPNGFCVTGAAQRRLRGQLPQADAVLSRQIGEAYQRLGGGPVAVRSSATAEDGAFTSFAGQQETILGVIGEAAVLDAVARCWASLDSERAIAYRRRQGVADDTLAMAVVVQRLVPAEVSGVLFTRDPLDTTGRRMLVEAAWGLGESVVSGRVMPDRYHLDQETGTVLDRHVSTKPTQLTADGTQPVPVEMQSEPCLDDDRLAELAELGRRVEAFYGDARDVEWAWAEGSFWLLQARPITTGGGAEREQVRREEIAALTAKAEPGGTVWARYNLAEILPEPTPMTWAIVQRFLSGRGGFGQMYRDLGFEPDPALDEQGIYDLVCGRPYCNLSREPRMQFRWLPFEHSFTALKSEPARALYPQPVLNPARGSWRFWALLPWLVVKVGLATHRLQRESATFARRCREAILPPFLAEMDREGSLDLSGLDSRALLDQLERCIRRTLHDFARDSLKPTVLAAVALGNLEQALASALGTERARGALGELTLGVRPDPEADLPAALRALAAGRLERQAFLQRFGHRGNHEMELAQPRWDEEPGALDRLTRQLTGTHSEPPPSVRSAATVWQGITAVAKWAPSQQVALRTELDRLHMYLGLRETAKHHLMKGYALIRKVLVELDRRYSLGGAVFYLTPEELPRLTGGEDLSALIAARRRRRALALSLDVPSVLFSDDLEAIGRPVPVAGADRLQGVPLSAGVAEGPALVLEEPTASGVPAEPYILVCPSTDPAWVPLFLGARGLVMETGGVLSHGAIVAREFGLPAVAGIPGVVGRLRSGQRLRVEGGSGTLWILQES